jgi:hypothetical protein
VEPLLFQNAFDDFATGDARFLILWEEEDPDCKVCGVWAAQTASFKLS